MPVAAPGAGQPLDPKTKKTILIGGIVIGALIVLGIVYGVLNSTVFSAKSVAQSYLTAIADGKYGKANGIADPQVGKDQLKLLSDTVAKADNATIANPHIDSVKTVEGVAKVNVTYSLNGKNVNDSLTINKDGSKFLLFPNWKISSPLLKTITVSVPNAVESLSVNGVDVTAKNAEKSDSSTWTLRVYPGSYKVSIGKSGYVTSGITMVRTNADSDAADLKIMPTAKLKEDLSKAVERQAGRMREVHRLRAGRLPVRLRPVRRGLLPQLRVVHQRLSETVRHRSRLRHVLHPAGQGEVHV